MPMFQPTADDCAERTGVSFAQQTIVAFLGAEPTQRHGFLHADATSPIADSAGGCAAFMLYSANASVPTAEVGLNLLAPVADGIARPAAAA